MLCFGVDDAAENLFGFFILPSWSVYDFANLLAGADESNPDKRLSAVSPFDTTVLASLSVLNYSSKNESFTCYEIVNLSSLISSNGVGYTDLVLY